MTEDSPRYGSKFNGEYSQLAKGRVGLPEVVAHPGYETFIQLCLEYHAATVNVSIASTTLESKKKARERATRCLRTATTEIPALAELLEQLEEDEEALHRLAGIAVDHWYKNRNR